MVEKGLEFLKSQFTDQAEAMKQRGNCELCGARTLAKMGMPMPRLCAQCEIVMGLDESEDIRRLKDELGKHKEALKKLDEGSVSVELYDAAVEELEKLKPGPDTVLQHGCCYECQDKTEEKAKKQNRPEPDAVYHPAHYTQWTLEPFTFLMINKVPFPEGCVVKYVLRWRQKNGLEDLRKARRILEMMIELEENRDDYMPKKGVL